MPQSTIRISSWNITTWLSKTLDTGFQDYLYLFDILPFGRDLAWEPALLEQFSTWERQMLVGKQRSLSALIATLLLATVTKPQSCNQQALACIVKFNRHRL